MFNALLPFFAGDRALVYVLNASSNEVQVRDMAGTLRNTFSIAGAAVSDFIFRHTAFRAVAVDEDRFYVGQLRNGVPGQTGNSQVYSRCFLKDGSRDSGSDLLITQAGDGEDDPQGMSLTSAQFVLIDNTDDRVRLREIESNTSLTFSVGAGIWTGVATSEELIYALDNSSDEILAWDFDRMRSQSADVSLTEGNWQGVASHRGRLYALDSQANSVAVWGVNGTRHINADFSLGDGDWKDIAIG